MAKKDAVRQFKKGLISEASHQLFCERCYEAVTVQDIADAAGMGKATLYQYFESKEEVLFSLLRRSSSEINRMLEACCDKGQDPYATLKEVISLTYREYLKNNRIFLTYMSLKRNAAFKREWVEELHALRDRKFELLATVLEKGTEQGVFIQVDSRRFARVLNNILRGFSLEPLEIWQGEPIRELGEEIIQSIIFKGILADGGGLTGE
ncbi:MAG: TetR/AcrR family transcriptional regulator [Syntrophomonas sp.]